MLRILELRLIIRPLTRDTEGSNALEFGLIVGLVSLAIVMGAASAGTALGSLLSAVGTSITNVVSSLPT
jgi:Flp pilus assembly pilin Flp